jgi:septation ring formation regulator EzrA
MDKRKGGDKMNLLIFLGFCAVVFVIIVHGMSMEKRLDKIIKNLEEIKNK